MKTLDPAALAAQYAQGSSIRQIGCAVGVSHSTVLRILKDSGVALRTKQETARKSEITGQRFGRLVAVRPTGESIYGRQIAWLFKCDCGATVVSAASVVKRGTTKSCGCLDADRKAAQPKLDIRGERYGRLVAVAPTGKTVCGSREWTFDCDCGNSVARPMSRVRSGVTSSCGCLHRELTSKARAHDLTGKAFGLLTGVRRVGKRGHNALWLFRCECGGTKEAIASNVVRGLTASCGCISGGHDSMEAWLDGTFREAEDEAFVYVYRLREHSDLVKIGIAKDLQDRARRSPEYGDLCDFIAVPRLDAWLLEQAALSATQSDFVRREQLLEMAGQTEVRRMSPEKAFQLLCWLHQELVDVGRIAFAVERVPMTAAQMAKLGKMAA